MAALLHIDVLRQHMLSSVIFPGLGPVVTSVPITARLRPVASWRIGPNGRPMQHWTVGGMAILAPPD